MTLGLIMAAIFLTLMPSAGNSQGFGVSIQRPEFTVQPGDRFTGSIPVTNSSEEQIALRMYIGDWIPIEGRTSGYNFVEEGGQLERSLMGWMTFSPERMTLEPGETREVVYEVNIPADPSLNGSYWAVIFIERIPEEEPELTPIEEGETRIGIRTVFRYAVQVYATVAGSENREATFTAMTMEPIENGFKAVATMQNNGNIYMRPKVWLEMKDITGEVVYTHEHEEQTVLPGTARDFVFELKSLPIESGEYLVMVIADYGLPTLIAAQGRVNLTITPPEPEEESEEEIVEDEEPEVEEEEPEDADIIEE